MRILGFMSQEMFGTFSDDSEVTRSGVFSHRFLCRSNILRLFTRFLWGVWVSRGCLHSRSRDICIQRVGVLPIGGDIHTMVRSLLSRGTNLTSLVKLLGTVKEIRDIVAHLEVMFISVGIEQERKFPFAPYKRTPLLHATFPH
jgi:hypothetical protein